MRPLVELAEQGDAHGLSELAHRLKGAARVIRAEPLIAACVDLEQACRTPAPEPSHLRATAGALRLALLELEQALMARMAADDQ
ncbi:Hpt domain protein [compost metagenome]